jgi:hypothetical protein
MRAFRALAVFLVTAFVLPWRLAAADAPDLLAPHGITARRLADGVASRMAEGVQVGDFSTGHRHFDREWLFGTWMMAAMGFGQLALTDPAARAEHLARMDTCLERLLDADTRAFDRGKWGVDPMEALDGERGHVAWLGYLDLALSLRRLVEPDGRWARLNDQLTAALVRRMERSPIVETFPNERYPVDNAAAVGAIGLYDRATGADHGALIRGWDEEVRRRFADGGVLVQAVDGEGNAIDAARGSGTFLAAWFLGYADPAMGRRWWAAARDSLYGRLLGFGAMREYAGSPPGLGDIDSGPVVAGYGVSATGFALGPARMHGDDAVFSHLLATAVAFGAPVDSGAGLRWATGGPIGDAILFAMLTTPRAEDLRR